MTARCCWNKLWKEIHFDCWLSDMCQPIFIEAPGIVEKTGGIIVWIMRQTDFCRVIPPIVKQQRKSCPYIGGGVDLPSKK